MLCDILHGCVNAVGAVPACASFPMLSVGAPPKAVQPAAVGPIIALLALTWSASVEPGKKRDFTW